MRRVVAPLAGLLHEQDHAIKAHDLVSAAKKQALVAALASSESTHNTKAYEKLSVPSFPKSDEMTNWMYFLATAAVVSGCYGDDEKGYMASGMLEQIF